MTEPFIADCLAIFNTVTGAPKRSSDSRIKVLGFLEQPVDLVALSDYSAIIAHPISFSEIRDKLQVGSPNAYNSPLQFIIEFRRVISNFMRYNWMKDMALCRNELRKMLLHFEEEVEKKYPGQYSAHPHLGVLLSAIENSLKLPSVAGGSKSLAVYSLFNNVNCYYAPDYHYPPGYLAAIDTPMCMNRILEKLIECGQYSSSSGSISIPKKNGKGKAKVATPAASTSSQFVRYYRNNTTEEVLEDVVLIRENIVKYGQVGGTNDLTATFIADAEAIERSIREFLEAAAAKAAAAPVPAPPVVTTTTGDATTLGITTAKASSKSSKKAPTPASPPPAPVPVSTTTATKPKLTLSLGKKSTAATTSTTTTTVAFSSSSSSASSTSGAGMHYSTSGIAELGQNSTFVAIALRVIFMEALQEVKRHFMVNRFNQARILTSGPFLKAVDPLKYPDYAQIVTNPMDLTIIEKKIVNNRYTAALSTVPAGKTTPLSSVLNLRSFSDGEKVASEESTGVVSAGMEAIWAIRCDFELLRSNAHLYNTGEQGLEVRLMVDALYDVFNYKMLELVTRVGQGIPLQCTSPQSQKWISGTSLATGSSSTRAEQAARYISVFHSLLYTFQAEHALKVASKQPRQLGTGEEEECRDKDGNILIGDVRLLRWLETASAPSEAVTTYLSVLEADRVEAERVEGERKAALLLKRVSAGPKVRPHVEAAIAAVAASPVEAIVEAKVPSGPTLTIKAPSRKSTGGKSKSSVALHNADSAETVLATESVTAVAPMDINMLMEVEAEPSYIEPQQAAVALSLPEQEVREMEPWENECAAIVKRICLHDFVAISKDITREKCICNFFAPVVLDAVKLKSLKIEPMDLTTLINMVESGGLVSYDGTVIPRVKDPEDFYRKLVSIFSSPVLQNEGSVDSQDPASFSSKVASRARTLARFSKWLCLEKLPLSDAPDDEVDGDRKSSAQLEPAEVSLEEADNLDPKQLVLTTAARDIQRRFRRDCFLKKFAPNEAKFSKDCTKLLNALEKACTRLKRDKMIYSWLSVPVQGFADYAVYVRNPMDIGTVKRKLEAFEYTSYHAFIEDLRLVFKNAVTYNSAHIESDTTGLSKEMVEKATSCMAALDEYLYPTFSVDVADRWDRADLLNGEARRKREKAEEIENKLLAEKAEFFAAEQAKLKLIDSKFAADMDIAKKRQESKKALQERADEENEAQLLIAGGLDEEVVESGAFKSWKYENIAGLVTSNKQLSSMSVEPSDADKGTIFFPGAQMLLPLPVSAPVPGGDTATGESATSTSDSITSSSSAVAVAAAPPSISITGSGMFAIIRPNYTRSQELFMKYQVARHHVRQRAWDVWVSRPGTQSGSSLDSVEQETETEVSVSQMDVDGDGDGAAVESMVNTEASRVFVDVSNIDDSEQAGLKRKHAAITITMKPVSSVPKQKHVHVLKPRLDWSEE